MSKNRWNNLINLLREPDGENVSRTEKAAALAISSVVNALLNVVLSMLAARLLTKTELAINSQTFLAVTTFTPILGLGVTQGIYYYLSHNEHRKRAVINEALLITSITSAVFCLFILFGGNFLLAKMFKNEALKGTLYFIIPHALLLLPSSVMNCMFVYENRLRFNAFFTAVKTLLTVSAVLITILISQTGLAMVITRAAKGTLFSLITFYLVYHFILSHEPKTKIEWSSIKALLKVSIPLGVASMLGTITLELDKWIISIMESPEVYAVYTHGAKELPFISVITGAISTVVLVDMTKAAKEKRYETAIDLFNSVAKKTSMIIMPIMMFCLVATRPILTFLFTADYLDASLVFRIYLLYMPIRVVVYGTLLIALGKSRLILIKTACVLIADAVLSVILVKLFGDFGAAIGTLLSVYLIEVPVNIIAISRAMSIKWTRVLPFKAIFINILASVPGALLCVGAELFFAQRLPSLIALIIEFILFIVPTVLLIAKMNKLSIKGSITAALNKIRSYV